MKALVARGLSTLYAPMRAAFSAKTRHVAATQEQFLSRLLAAHRPTQLGRDLHLDAVQTVRDFRDRVPISTYEDYEPYVERVARGEVGVMTPDPVIYLNMTSGTTGKQKLIPVTWRSRRFRNRATLLSISFLIDAMRRRNLKFGDMLVTSSLELLGTTSGGIDFGPASVGDLRLQTPWLKELLLAHPFAALRVDESAARHYVCLLFALGNAHTCVIAANFPVLGLVLAEYLQRFGDRLLDDLARGTISLAIAPDLKTRLERRLQPRPERARQLAQVLAREGRLTPRSVFPDLSAIITARGGNSDFFFQRFPEYYGDVPIFGGIYSSAEGAYGMYRDVDEDGAILALDSGFYEFVPSEAWHESPPPTVLAHEVERGQQYRLVFTNYNGFYRYDFGDVVEVLDFYNKTPIVTFRYRFGGLLSSTTEKTTEFHVVKAMKRVQQEFDVAIAYFCITLATDRTPPPYLINVELAGRNTLDNPRAFLQHFDRQLQEVHASYAVKRRQQVPPPRLRLLASGSGEIVRQRAIERGIPEHHLKLPNISEDREFLNGISVLQEVRLVEDGATLE